MSLKLNFNIVLKTVSVVCPGLKHGRRVTLTIHSHLVPRSKMSRSYISSPPSTFMACSGTALAIFLKNI
jgi:hypothetical protein